MKPIARISCLWGVLAWGISASAQVPGEPPADPPDAVACVAAHASAQERRLEGALLEARDALRSCGHAECPAVVRADCVRWLSEVQPMVPSLRFLAEVDGVRSEDVVVTLDGEPVPEDRRSSVEVDPGLHRVRFLRDGLEPVTIDVAVRQGERNLVVLGRLQTPPEEPAEDPSVLRRATRTDRSPDRSGTAGRSGPLVVPISAWIVGGVSIASLVAAVTLGTHVLVERDVALSQCAPFCDRSFIDRLRAEQIAADVLFGVALLGGATSVLLALLFGERAPAVDVALAPMSDGAMLWGGARW